MPPITIEKLMESVSKYIHRENDLNLIRSAYNYSFLKHDGQLRRSGEPYIIHPLAVAYILADLAVGPATISAALLHDTIEDTTTSYDDIVENFGQDVAQLVEGVTKINKLNFESKEKAQDENHQKILLAMASDIRVILIKLADRLHNMRTMDAMPREAQVRIARETLEIYSPLAHKLGMFRIKAELEDRALRYENPDAYYHITNLIKAKKSERENLVSEMIENIKEYFKVIKLEDYEIKGRIKNIYSIYKKMYNNDRDFSDIYDLLAIRIIVDKVETCYQALGIIHAHYVPLPKRFKDYIAVPKLNLYQSLHTTVVGVEGEIFEIQIRTKEMDNVAEVGIAAHWAYKENIVYSKEREQFEIANTLKWYGDFLKIAKEKQHDGAASEFMDAVKSDVLKDNIIVLSPQREAFALPKGSTPLDFAYKIHTDVGHKAVGALVNNKMVPLDYELAAGDLINIKTSKQSPGPSEGWLKIVKTNHAKTKIRNFLNSKNRDNLVLQGKEEMEREIIANKVNEELTEEFVLKHFAKNGIKTIEDLYAEIGKKIISPKTVVAKLQGTEVASDFALQKQMEKAKRIMTTKNETGVIVEGLKNAQIKLGNCCNPIKDEAIVGYVSRGNGVIVHTEKCRNVNQRGEERIIEVYWAQNVTRRYPCKLKISAFNHNNVFSDIITTINSSNAMIASANAHQNLNLKLVVKVKILIERIDDLNKLIANLGKISDIYSIEREQS